MKSRSALFALCTVLAAGAASVAFLNGCASTPQAAANPLPSIAPPALTDDKPRDYAGLHNVVTYHEGFYSGSVPEGEAAFDTLAAMGVKTIISVDGAETEVEQAAARGIRYIHLPIGYNGFDEARKLELVRATRDAMKDGPVYMHCHHGKHRSAGAAGAVAVSLGWLTNEQALGRMKVSGTAPSYKGLYACTASAGMLSADVIDAVSGDFPANHKPQGFVKSMVDIDVAMENLKAIEKNGWKAPKELANISPAAEAGKLADLLRFLDSDARTRSKPAEFAHMLKDNDARASKLEDLLAAGETDVKKLSDQFKLVAASCKDCHVKFRD